MDIFNRIDVFNQYRDVVMEGVSVDNGESVSESVVKNVGESVDNHFIEDLSIERKGNNSIDNIDNIDIINLNESNSNETNQSNENNENNENNHNNEVIDINSTGGIIYDLLHILDDMYVYGRTFIENNYFNLSENDDFNLVYPNIYVGNYSTSTNYKLLKDLGITHIISVIPSFNPPFEDKFKYLHIEAYDDETQDMKQYFEISNEFISHCLNEGGKILIHCMAGRSRSITLFLAFLIYIVQGNFNKNILNLYSYDNDSDIYSSTEYNKFIKINKDRKKNNSYDGINNSNSDGDDNSKGNNDDNIYTVDHIKPQLNNRAKNFVLYKKENMFNDVDELMRTYTILKKEITVEKKRDAISTSDNDNSLHEMNKMNTILKNMKKQSGNHFIIQLIKYIQKYRSIANPNQYFINQLSETIF